MNRLAIIGGGSWGTALAKALAPRFNHVTLWVRDPELAASINSTRENARYLPGFVLPENVAASGDLENVLTGAPIVMSVIPAAYTREIYRRMLPFLLPEMVFVSATKGIENGSLQRISAVISDVVGARFPARVSVLSGPTFAKEIAAGDPAAVVIASSDLSLAAAMQRAYSGPSLRFYASDDIIGVEIGAALKNVIAIGAGICHGLSLGGNSIAALVTRGLAEISRLAVALGGKPRTLAGLAGLGDLVLTSTGQLSRNRFVGTQLAAGHALPDILKSMNQVAEGVETCRAARDLAHRSGVEMPIVEEMYKILYEQKPVREALRELMDRPLTSE